MSAPLQQQILAVFPTIQGMLAHPQTFPLPPPNPAISLSDHHAQIRGLLSDLETELEEASENLETLNTAHTQWMSLRASMTGNERLADNDVYVAFVAATPYPNTQAALRQYIKGLKAGRKALQNALPDTHNPTSLTHLPRMPLPSFNGQNTEYPGFLNQFNSAIGNLPIADSVKLSYLRSCLKDAALSLINPLPLTDDSYSRALDLLAQKYNNPLDISRALLQNLRSLPPVRKGEMLCSDLAILVETVEGLALRMQQHGGDPNALNVQLEIEGKFPNTPFILEEVYKAREETIGVWTTAHTLEKLKQILKRREQIHSICPPPPPKPSYSQQTSQPQKPRPASNPPQQATVAFHSQSPKFQPKLPCQFCSQLGHFASRCPVYVDVQTRRNRIMELKLCLKCIKQGHFSKQCPKPAACGKCKEAHPTALCKSASNTPSSSRNPPASHSSHYVQNQAPNQAALPSIVSPPVPPPLNAQFYPPLPSQNPTSSSTNPMPPPPPPKDNERQSYISAQEGDSNSLPVLLKCVRATLFNPDDPSKQFTGIIMLDDGSTDTYIKQHAADRMRLRQTPTSIDITVAFSPESNNYSTFSTSFGLQLMNGRTLIIPSTTLPHLTTQMPYIPFRHDISELAEFSFDMIRGVEPIALIGSDYYNDLEPTPIRRLPSGYHFVQTLVGPLISGRPNNPLTLSRSTNVIQPSPPIPSEYFALEGIGIIDSLPLEANDILDKFNSSIEMIDGRYHVEFPWKTDPQSLTLPSYFGLCYGRLQSVIRSLQSRPEILAKYSAIIAEQIHLGIVEPVPHSDSFSPPLHYLAHHPVMKPPPSQKVRIVYDGSAHTGREPSINDCLHPGPTILADLVGVLLRFRMPLFVIVTDIEKAFLQVGLKANQRDCTRFLWLKDPMAPLTPSNLQTLRFARVPFGLAPSPFLLAATIKYHLNQYPSPLSDEVMGNIYVDNILLSSASIPEGKDKCAAVISLFQSAKMELREFVSNSSEILASLPSDRKLSGPSQKFLGIKWHTDSDVLSFPVVPPTSSDWAKRGILSFNASFFDPHGYLSPLLLPLKIFLQTLWEAKTSWDEPLPPEITQNWLRLFSDWPKFSEVTIPRRPTSFLLPQMTAQLHCFCDASNLAMCAAVYLRTSIPSSPVCDVSILFSKTKVKPLNPKSRLTIPRLELLAARMGTKMISFIHSQLSQFPIQFPLFLWTDSSAVIGWIGNPPADIFVQNSLKIIQETPNLQISHVAGLMNPADLGTRGVPSPSSLQNSSLWWSGPDWLHLPPDCWPSTPGVKTILTSDIRPIVKKPSPPIQIFTSIQSKPCFDPSQYSRLPKLLRLLTYSFRFLTNCRPKLNEKFGIFLSSQTSPVQSELRSAFEFLLHQEQRLWPPSDDVRANLGLFLDESGLLRAEGRLGQSSLRPETIRPIFLSHHSPLSRLFLYETHLINAHSSPLLTLSIVRRSIWITHGRRAAERAIHLNCATCRRFKAKPFDPPPFPPLPSSRVQASPPFAFVGLDYCGPLHLLTKPPTPGKSKRSKKPETQKYWISLWVCLYTRALSLDLVPDSTASSFLLSYRRFAAKFGRPFAIYSDNGSNFVAFRQAVASSLPPWHFRAPMAAWKGGHYERMVGLIKTHLRRTLSRGLFPSLTLPDPIRTTLAEIETVINSRPISFCSSNPADPLPLRPIDFLRPLGQPNLPVLPGQCPPSHPPSSDPLSLRLLWNTLQKRSQNFAQQWSADYLLSLRERQRKIAPKNDRLPHVGDLVLVQADTPRTLWPIAVILSIKDSATGFPDTATVRLPSGRITSRSVSHLYPLETWDKHIPPDSPPPLSQAFTPPPPPSITQELSQPIPSLPPVPNPVGSTDLPPPPPVSDNSPPPQPEPSSDHFLQLRSRRIARH